MPPVLGLGGSLWHRTGSHQNQPWWGAARGSPSPQDPLGPGWGCFPGQESQLPKAALLAVWIAWGWSRRAPRKPAPPPLHAARRPTPCPHPGGCPGPSSVWPTGPDRPCRASTPSPLIFSYLRPVEYRGSRRAASQVLNSICLSGAFLGVAQNPEIIVERTGIRSTLRP